MKHTRHTQRLCTYFVCHYVCSSGMQCHMIGQLFNQTTSTPKVKDDSGDLSTQVIFSSMQKRLFIRYSLAIRQNGSLTRQPVHLKPVTIWATCALKSSLLRSNKPVKSGENKCTQTQTPLSQNLTSKALLMISQTTNNQD